MTRHIIQISALTIAVIVFIFYPFLPGTYDSAALGLSTAVQLFEVVGLLLVPLGFAWMFYEVRKQARRKKNLPSKSRGYRFALSALIIVSILLVPVSLLILFGIGISFDTLTLALWFFSILRLRSKLRALKETEGEGFNPAPLYLIFIPLIVLVAQILLARPATEFSRNYVIAHSAELIDDIEQYHTTYGKYPEALQAVWKDYYPDVVGIEKFHYVPYADAYNLYFEQPRLFFDIFGTREFVVYNPSDEHLMLSHTSWFMLLTPQELEENQGWYEFHDASSPHWKYFWFDSLATKDARLMNSHKAVRTLYQKLITLYPPEFNGQLGESMAQTFNDLYNEKSRHAQHKWFGFVLWTFVETAIGIVREHALLIKEINPMKNILTNLRSSAIISFLLLIPFIILEWATRADASRTNASMMLWVILWLLSMMFLVILIPVVRNVRAGNILMANSVSLLPRVFFLVVLAWMWVALIIDQMPCFLGGSGC